MSTSSTQALVSKYLSPIKETRILRKLVNSRLGYRKYKINLGAPVVPKSAKGSAFKKKKKEKKAGVRWGEIY